MKLLTRPRAHVALQDRLVWQAASLLLAYPDERLADRLRTVDELRAGVTGPAADLLARTASALRMSDPMTRATDYVETFDLRRRSTLYLTYWTAATPATAAAKCSPSPRCTAMPACGRRSTRPPTTCRWCWSSPPPSTPLRADGCSSSTGCRSTCVRAALTDCRSPYADTVAAVCETLPSATDQEVLRAQRLAQAGPPAEAVGLQPFTLTVPPRRTEGDR